MTSFSLDSHFAGVMGDLLGPEFPDEIGLAVSGGGDSMALLTLAHNWTRHMGVGLRVVTVDHGLRPESGAEAALVAAECAALGHRYDVLRWQGWDGSGNLQEAARTARLRLIGRWRGGLRHVLMAHTLDDQAETVLMRLARGSGLAGMADRRFVPQATEDGGFWLMRPLLTVRRAELRHYLTVLKGAWVEDPSNADRRFDRVRMRQALEVLAPLGLDAAALAETAGRMARAQAALRARAAEAATRAVRVQHGDLLMDRDALAALEAETRLRLLAGGGRRPGAVGRQRQPARLPDAGRAGRDSPLSRICRGGRNPGAGGGALGRTVPAGRRGDCRADGARPGRGRRRAAAGAARGPALSEPDRAPCGL